MTNPNYYHHQKQEDATEATTSFIVAKTSNSQSDTKISSSPLRSTAPNSASSSPVSFSHNSLTNSNPGNSSSNIMATANHHASGEFSTTNDQQQLEHRCYNSTPQNSNLGPLSPQSAPPATSVSVASTTPVPSVIHTEVGVDGETTMAASRTHSSAPYFPSMNKSTSAGSFSSASNLLSKKSSTKVTGKKKHQTSKPKPGSNPTSSPKPYDGGSGTTSSTNGQKKQRRLERNRLSAQLSRRRRKQYLEELEDRVVRLSLDMDSGRRAHAFQAIDRISELRQQVLASAEAVVREIESGTGFDDNNRTMMLNFQLENSLRLLENAGPLSRTNSEELLILNSFLGQQLKSFSLPSHAKFILWLSLQGDIYYRGGRAASERLSAARIGERVSFC